MEFIKENWEIIVIIIPLILSAIGNVNEMIKSFVSAAMLFAEKKAGEVFEQNGVVTGQQKKEFVVDYVYNKIPKPLHLVFGKEYVAQKIERLIVDIKDIKDDGKLNASAAKNDNQISIDDIAQGE